ncbi:MAG: hypothetical protein HZA90_10785 [Verrucomicrobia bacterium]|nr:hypothetical protein [Verrucomicrobiota bacterium]
MNLTLHPDFLDHSTSRRHFLAAVGAAALAPSVLTAAVSPATSEKERKIVPTGPASKYTPKIWAAFVRRKGDYGIRWPGAVYDGEAARRDYTQQIAAAEKELGLKITLRPEPIFSAAEAEAWLAEAKATQADGLLVVLLDRQEHAWPTATKAADSKIPTVIFAPLGAAFTTNTAPLAQREGVFLSSALDFTEARYGLKMLRAAAKLREMRYLVIQGAQRRDSQVAHFGTRLRHLPASSFLDEYNRTPLTDEIKSMASGYLRSARSIKGATKDDLLNGIKSYVVARNILEREEGDGITMDCLGALGKTKVSLPCIAWSKMLDHGIPAACEADIGAALTHALVQLLFDRPGFQQDPVAETARQCLIGAHCSCPTRLAGFDQKPERYEIIHHHGNRDAVPRALWRVGQRVTIADVMIGKEVKGGAPNAEPKPQLVIGTGAVVDNLSVPPHGGCVVSVMVKLDTQPDLLSYPGFHQLFFYGDFKKELLAYCRLFGVEPVVA